MERVLIVGNGYAGLTAAKALAREARIAVTMVSAEDCPAYCPHLLPEIAAGRKRPEEIRLLEGGGYPSLPVAWKGGAAVEALSASRRVARLSNGETIAFDKALIATGAKVWVPEGLKGVLARCENVIAMKRLEDALALRGYVASGAARIAVIGAGRVGMLLAEALQGTVATVSVVEIGPAILATMLEADVAARLHPALSARRHLRLHTGAHIAGVSVDDENVREIHLADGAAIPCDVVVIATGAEPNTGFLTDGLAGGSGIPVNRRMETSEPGIYAAGDAVRFETITGRTDVGQLALNARAQGAVAAANIAGGNAVCPPSFIGNIVKLDPVIAARIGEIDGTDRIDFTVGRSFARATLSGREVIGLQLVGDPEDLSGLVPAVLKKIPPGELEPLFRGRLDMGLAPLLASRSLSWA